MVYRGRLRGFIIFSKCDSPLGNCSKWAPKRLCYVVEMFVASRLMGLTCKVVVTTFDNSTGTLCNETNCDRVFLRQIAVDLEFM